MRYLVTGGAGFIGSHLCEALLASGHTVRVLDNFSTGKHDNLPDGVELITGDIANRDLMGEVVQGIDGCFHLAAIASVTRGMTDWLGTHRTNQTGIITLFDALVLSATHCPVVYASSAAIYGDAAPPIAEDATMRPLSAYGADKLGCELHAYIASYVHNIPTVGLRFFNVYGPRQDPASPYSGVISIFCNKLLQGEQVTIFGDGEQTRDFVYVSDVVTALIASMQYPTKTVYNVCTGHATSIKRLAEIIHRLVQPSGVHKHANYIKYGPARVGDVRYSTGLPDRAKQALNLPDPVPLQVGLRHVLEWLQGPKPPDQAASASA